MSAPNSDLVVTVEQNTAKFDKKISTDNEGGLLAKPKDQSSSDSSEKKSMAVTISSHAKRMFEGLYHYTISSWRSSLQLSNYWRSDEPPAEQEPSDEPDIKEMGSYPPGNVETGAPTSKESRKEPPDNRMKKKINLHFESHLQKWKRQRFPFKVTLHLLLIVLVTTQVMIFANDNSKFTKFLIGNEEAFELYFKLTKCDQSQEVEKLYTLQDVYSQVDHIVDSYYNISEQAVGSFRYVDDNDQTTTDPPILSMEVVYYELGCGRDESRLFPYTNPTLKWYTNLFPQNVFENDSANSTDEPCCNTEMVDSRCSKESCDCSVEEQIECYINNSNLDRVSSMLFNFTLSTFFRDQIIEDKASVRAKFYIEIALVNDLYSSMTVGVNLDSDLTRYCGDFSARATVLDIIIIILLVFSSMTYVGSIIRTYRLGEELKLHFLAYHNRQLRWEEIHVLYNKWYIFMLFTEVLLFVSIILKIKSEYTEEIYIPLVECVRVLLGGGVFLLWCGLFGLLSYFEPLNQESTATHLSIRIYFFILSLCYVLFITIRLAIPSVLRFAVCVFILFAAFSLCGWLVLGPYHPKFDDFALSLESLFCIIIGDDLFTTLELAHSNNQSRAVKIFSEVYLILFIFIFIYAVLSLFIGIFNHAYESLSDRWNEYSRGFLRDWAEGEHNNDPTKNYPFPVPPIRNLPSSTNSMKSPPSDQQEVGTISKHSQAKVLTAQPPLAKDDQIKDAWNKLSMNEPTNARNSMVAANRGFNDDDDGGNN